MGGIWGVEIHTDPMTIFVHASYENVLQPQRRLEMEKKGKPISELSGLTSPISGALRVFTKVKDKEPKRGDSMFR